MENQVNNLIPFTFSRDLKVIVVHFERLNLCFLQVNYKSYKIEDVPMQLNSMMCLHD